MPPWALFPGDVAYVWHAGVHAKTVAESLEAVGFLVRSQIIWSKPRFVLGRGDYHWQHEPCFCAVRKRRDRPLAGRARPVDRVGHRHHRRRRRGHGPRHPKTGRMHAPPDDQQQRQG
jgi:hypothetical protein